MAELDTYPAVQDEEEEKKRNPYPGAVGPMPTPTPAPVPAAVPPPEMPQTQYPAPSMGARTQPPAPLAPPTWKEYAPSERHGWGKVGSVLAALNPATNQIFNELPQQRASQRYGDATKEYESQQAEELAGRKESSEAALKGAQTGEAVSRGKQAEATAAATTAGTELVPWLDSKTGAVQQITRKQWEDLTKTGMQVGGRQKVAETQGENRLDVKSREGENALDLEAARKLRDESVARIRATQQPLMVIATPEGPRYVPRSQASGQTPARVLGPQEHLKISQNQGQLNLALPRAQYLHDHADTIANLIDSGKIAFSIGADGTLQASIGKGMPLTPEESTFAANFQNMTEDINLLRAPLGATGFRSEQAFEALQAQRGRLAQNPDVFKKVLEGTIASMQSLQQTNKDALEQAQPAAATTPASGGGDTSAIELERGPDGKLRPKAAKK